jgi:hypothetical protein
MKKIIFYGLLIWLGFHFFYQDDDPVKNVDHFTAPLVSSPYVHVYGRNSCSVTKKTLRRLRKLGIPHKFKNIDDRRIEDVLHQRMISAGINAGWYNLPVVDVSGHIKIRPKKSWIIDKFSTEY